MNSLIASTAHFLGRTMLDGHSLVLLAGILSAYAPAQVVTFPSPSPVLGFGTAALIVSDMDGGGRRDIVVSRIDAGSGTSEVFLMSTETTLVIANLAINGTGFGTAMANLGNTDGVPGEEFVVSAPNLNATNGALFVFSGASGAGLTVTSAISVPLGFGVSLVTLPNLNGAGNVELAVGSTQAEQVQVVDTGTGGLLFTINAPAVGAFATSMAASGTRLAVGAPLLTVNTFLLGAVTVFNLSGTGATVVASFAAPGAANNDQRLGHSLAAIGDLNADGLSEWAVHAPAGGGFPANVHVFSETAAGAPLASLNYGNPGTASGHIAALGDVNGDTNGDFAMTDGQHLRVFATPAATALTTILTVPAGTTAFRNCLVSGPDTLGEGVFDLITGSIDNTTGLGLVAIQPLAVLQNLPNPPGLTAANPAQRPIQGSVFSLPVATTNPTSVVAALMVDFAPAKNIPFGNGTSFVSTNGSATTVGVAVVSPGIPTLFTNITLPAQPVFLYHGLVFQAGAVTQTGAVLVSNGLLMRLGTQ